MSQVKKFNEENKTEPSADAEEPGSSITTTKAEDIVVDVVQGTVDAEQRSGTHTSIDVNNGSHSEEPGSSHNEIQVSNWKYKCSHPLQIMITPLDSGIQTRSKTETRLPSQLFFLKLSLKISRKQRKILTRLLLCKMNFINLRGIVSKARLVVQGYNQEEGIDYDETFAPVARMEAIRILIAFASHMEFKLFQMDVKSAFLNEYLKEEVFVKQPPRFECHEHPEHVFKLDKALYGLKQAPRAWYEILSKFLLENSFTRG
ncbi:uncharacterized protein [Nicotiana tomentosiformis]|uniref:uncharacterized protein n=1 Tax=Nicotiana tomentosiformis TaxID=4098 RepID=UPI00388CCE06